MQVELIDEAIALLEKANANLEPELLSTPLAKDVLAKYARVEKLASFGKTALARKVDDAQEIARLTGTSMGKARTTVQTARALRDSEAVSAAFGGGDISFEQATEIVKAEVASPGSATDLLNVAQTQGFHILKEKSRSVVLDAAQTRGLTERQREARSARTYVDDLGMMNINLRLTPTLGTAIVNRAEDEARRLHREARREGKAEPYERHLADAFGAMLAGAGTKSRTKRAELVILVSHEVAKRGWTDVRPGEMCKIPGVGPVAPDVAREIADDAFLSGLFYDGKDLRHIKSWTRDKPVELQRALQLGPPPDFDGIKCGDCGNRFRSQGDHVEPFNGGANPTCLENHEYRCYECHAEKTKRDRAAGKFGRTAERGPPPDD